MKAGILILFSVLAVAASLALLFPTHQSILDRAYNSVVVVACPDGYGTGWFINDHEVVTAAHVVQSCIDNVTVLRDPYTSKAVVEHIDPDTDLAVLRVVTPRPPGLTDIPLAKSIYQGQDIIVIGYPVELYQETGQDIIAMSKQPRVAYGSIAWLHMDGRTAELDARVDAGNSGGPVIDAKNGGIVGIVDYARPGVAGTGYFVLRADIIATKLDAWGVEYSIVHPSPARLILLSGGILGALILVVFTLFRGGRSG